MRLTTNPSRDPGPGFPLLSSQPPVIAICGQVTTIHEEQLLEQVDRLSPQQMREIAVGLLEVTQAHRLPGLRHPDIAERTGPRQRRRR